MSFLFFIGIAAILFVIGILLIIKGASIEESEAVPISNPEEIEALKNSFMLQEQKSSVESNPSANKVTRSVVDSKPKGAKLFLKSSKHVKIEQLMEENRRLKIEIAEQNNKFQLLEQNLEVLKKEYYQIKEAEAEKTQILQSKIAKIQIEKEQLSLNVQIIEELKQKAELFDKQIKENQIRQSQMKEFMGQLESERDSLMKAQKLGVDKSDFEAMCQRLEGSIKTIEVLKGESKNLQNHNRDLKDNFKKTEEYNKHLLEKEKILQYELAKNRAQNLGLEKICEDFKQQIEMMSSANSGRQQAT